MKKGKLLLSIVTILALTLTSCNQNNQTNNENNDSNSVKSQISEECTNNGGTWLEEFNECEYIGKDWCEKNAGTFYECESACRNDPEAEICTMQCVQVCKFGEKKENGNIDNSNANNIESSNTDALNTSYIIDGEKVSLIKGKSEKEIVPDSASKEITEIFSFNTKADLNNDGLEDTVVLLTRNSGGSGTFFYVAAAINTKDGVKGSNAVLVGDRIAPQTTDYRNGEIIVNYAKRFPWESFSERPSMGTSKYLTFENGELKEKKLEQLTLEKAKELTIQKNGDCEKNECDNLQVNILDGKDGIWYIESIYEGLKDDSLNAKKIINQVHFVNSKWEVGSELVKEFKCQEGRGHQDFSNEFCK